MAQYESLIALRALTGETNNDALLTAYLDLAGEAIVNRCYPFGSHDRSVPKKYRNLQLEIAVYLFNKRGAEGQLVHSENGISRTYESASVPESMLKGVVPFIGTFGEVSECEMFTEE